MQTLPVSLRRKGEVILGLAANGRGHELDRIENGKMYVICQIILNIYCAKVYSFKDNYGVFVAMMGKVASM